MHTLAYLLGQGVSKRKKEEKYIIHVSKGNTHTVFQLFTIDGGYTEHSGELR